MNTTKPQIVLVEDSLEEAELVSLALQSNSYPTSIVHLENGAEALDYFFCKGAFEDRDIRELPNLILLDLNMPKIGGLEVVKKIKSDERTKAVPIVVMTSSTQDSDIIESYRLGANSFIVKPVAFDDFTKAIIQIANYWLLTNRNPVMNYSR